MRISAPLSFLLFAAAVSSFGADHPRDLNTPRTFPEISTKAAWQKRAEQIREHVLVSCGLWPLPAKTPLNAHIFGRIERDGYSVEKVYLETRPGFFLGGNLYRPLGRGNGPFPAILNPHGHRDEGRLIDKDDVSIPARCISFARQGMIAFSYDMAGYNDTRQVQHRAFALAPANSLWSISLMGLQTWDSIRALDFLESLPAADKKRLACTGESGGGTQTFMLGSVDSRLAAQAPVVMVSHTMQGGCLCENAPGLRVDFSNMEIAAVPAPRPQILVAATGDWTRATMTVEGPALEHIYELFGARDHLRYVIFPYNHNYNKTSREAVYAWFGKWLLHDTDPEHFKEAPYKKEPDADLLAFDKDELPNGALTQDELIVSMITAARLQLAAAQPHDSASLRAWKKEWRPLWEHALQLSTVSTTADEPARDSRLIQIKRTPGDSQIEIRTLRAVEKPRTIAVILSANPHGNADEIARAVTSDDTAVWQITAPSPSDAPDQFKNFFTTYNRTWVQDRVADLDAVRQYARREFPKARVILAGAGDAGLAALAAAPLFDGTAADCNQLDDSKDQNLLDPRIYFPGLRRAGGLQGIAALAAPGPLYLHNTGEKLELNWLPALYRNGRDFRRSAAAASAADLAQWISVQTKG